MILQCYYRLECIYDASRITVRTYLRRFYDISLLISLATYAALDDITLSNAIIATLRTSVIQFHPSLLNL